jgi:D-alanyl-D-alanine carboxypeptidase/D-alanyl-D-alanine-endopeptidase (penicillin-binding protein 4)
MHASEGGPVRNAARGSFGLAAALAAVIAFEPALARSDPPAGPPSAATTSSGARVEAAPIVGALRSLAAEVARWGGTTGAAVVDVGTGELLASVDEHAPMNPASNAKLATAAAALARLGPGHRYLTGLYGAVSGDTVADLVLRGDGDPSLRARDLWALAHELASAGVRRVGGIAVDQSFFDGQFVPPAFEQQPDEWSSFRAPVAAVSLEENSVLVSVRPTERGKPAALDVAPSGFVELAGGVRTTAKKDPEKLSVSLEPKGDRLLARVAGHVPEGGRTAVLARRVDDPRLFAGWVLREALREAGVKVSGSVRAGGEGERHLLAAHRSAPLGQLVGALGKDSDNFVAEMIFKSLGAAAKGRPATAEAAADAVGVYLRGLGAFEAGSVVRNGSGLFDANRTTPLGLATLLRAAYRDPAVGPELVAQLSIAGVDGTMRGRLRAWAATRAVRAKTGTLKSVAALSGYVLGPPGRSPLAFALLVNGIPDKVPAARPLMDKVVDAIARQRWAGDPALPTPAP